MPRPSSHPPWGWTRAVQVLLSIVAAVCAGGVLLCVPTSDQSASPPPALVVDLNTAPPAVLMALPRLGPVLVERVVAAREEAPFRSLEDFDARVKGIGPATVAALRPYVRVGPAPLAPKPHPSPRVVSAATRVRP